MRNCILHLTWEIFQYLCRCKSHDIFEMLVLHCFMIFPRYATNKSQKRSVYVDTYFTFLWFPSPEEWVLHFRPFVCWFVCLFVCLFFCPSKAQINWNVSTLITCGPENHIKKSWWGSSLIDCSFEFFMFLKWKKCVYPRCLSKSLLGLLFDNICGYTIIFLWVSIYLRAFVDTRSILQCVPPLPRSVSWHPLC